MLTLQMSCVCLIRLALVLGNSLLMRGSEGCAAESRRRSGIGEVAARFDESWTDILVSFHSLILEASHHSDIRCA